MLERNNILDEGIVGTLSMLACAIYAQKSAADILKQHLKETNKKLYKRIFRDKDTKISEDQTRKVESEYLAFIIYIIRKTCLTYGIPDEVTGAFRQGVINKLSEIGMLHKVMYYESLDESIVKCTNLIKMFDNRFNIYSEASIIHDDDYNPMRRFSLIVAKNVFCDILSDTDLHEFGNEGLLHHFALMVVSYGDLVVRTINKIKV